MVKKIFLSWKFLLNFTIDTLILVRLLHNSGMSFTAQALLIKHRFRHSAIPANIWMKFTLRSGLTVGHSSTKISYSQGRVEVGIAPSMQNHLRLVGSCLSPPVKERGFGCLHFASRRVNLPWHNTQSMLRSIPYVQFKNQICAVTFSVTSIYLKHVGLIHRLFSRGRERISPMYLI